MNYFLTITACLILSVSTSFAAEKANSLDPRLSGGQGTVFAEGKNAYSLPSRNIPMSQKLNFSVGNSFFRNPWVIAPATTDVRDGLGPLLNTNGCQNCHIKDGRGHAPASLEDHAVSLLVRLSIPSGDRSIPEPTYGGQLQDFANPGINPEGHIQIDYTPVKVTFADGHSVALRQPHLRIEDLGYGDLHPETEMSARIAPAMIGLGLLEAISAQEIIAGADPKDTNKDGISGRVKMVEDLDTGEKAIGRFGWKAGQPNVRQQNAGAFNGDLGVTSELFPKDDCTATQKNCLRAKNGGEPELTETILDAVTFYAKSLAVPARRNVNDPQVQKGEVLFEDIGCASCHTPQWTTGTDAAMPWLSEQVIFPYTDMLLHDMGEGLADHRPEGEADGSEWKTPALWGIGLAQTVHEEAGFLHDGRARTLMEAVLWHGGEAQESQTLVTQLSHQERQALMAFLESL